MMPTPNWPYHGGPALGRLAAFTSTTDVREDDFLRLPIGNLAIGTDPVRVARGKEHIDPRSGTEGARLYDLCRAEKDRARGIAQPVQTHKHDCG
jgi:hypothetical protein